MIGLRIVLLNVFGICLMRGQTAPVSPCFSADTIPVYKSEKFIANAVDSVLRQSFSDFEIVLVDDGSPDESLKLCQELSKSDSRIKVFHKENGGICSARNYGIEHATGKYLAFLDHDDEYMEGYLEDNLSLIQKYDADVVKFGRVNKVWNDNSDFKMVHEKNFDKIPGMKDGVVYFDRDDLVKNYCSFRDAVKTMYIWDGMYSADLIRRNNIRFDERFRYGHEDNMFNLDVFKVAGSVVFNNKEYYLHNYDSSISTSAVYRPVRIDDAIRVTCAEVGLLSSWNTDETESLISIMNNFFLVMNILNLKKGEVKYKEQRAAILKFRDASFPLLKEPGKAVKNLRKRDKKTALWASCLKNRWVFLSVMMYKAYRRYLEPRFSMWG